MLFFDAMRNSGGTTPKGGTYRNNVSKVGYYGTYTGYVAAEYTDTVINRLCSGSYYSRGDINTNVYAKIRPGDVLVTYTSGGLGHIMMVTGVELKYNGKYIDAEENGTSGDFCKIEKNMLPSSFFKQLEGKLQCVI